MSTQYLLHVASLQDIRWDSKLHNKLPDLYVVVKLGDASKQTRVVKRKLSPTWDEVLTLSSDPGADLIIELKHKSAWKSDPCVGSASIRIDELLHMCTESEASIYLHKKGSGAWAGTLHVRLGRAELMSNAELDVKAASEDIKQLAEMEVGSTTATALVDGIDSTEGDLYKSIGALLSKLDVFVGIIDDISKIHPYLAAAWQVTMILYKGVSRTFRADKKVIDLMLIVVEAFGFVRDVNALSEKARSLEETIISLLKQTTEYCLFVKEYARRGFASRMFLDVGSIKKIDEFSESFTTLKKALDSNISLHTAFVSSRILDKVDAIHLRMQLNPDSMSAFNRPLCLPGTRIEIQKQIINWVMSDTDQNIFWLHGVAGSGKSTISTTIAEHFRGLHRLGSFLFFERGKSDPSSVIRTMAFGLACADSSIAKQISAAIDLDGDLASASAAVQFEELVIKPLISSATDLHGPVLVVLDALDECGTLETRSTLLELLHRELHKLPKNIRILITSRKESDIEKALSNQPESVIEVELDYASGDSQHDVLEYIRFEMTRRVKEKVSIPEDWPWEANMILLAKTAAGLFIWASTAVKLVSSRRDDPFQVLDDLVSNLRSLSRFGLSDLYSNVLRHSGISWDNEVSRTRFSQVLGLILLSRVPISIDTIDGILDFPSTRSSKHILSGLQCLLVYSADAPIHLFHTSFSDYLLSPERSDDPWFIDISAQMTYITLRCFGVMKDMLHFNICNLETSFVPNDHVPGLEDLIKENIPPHLAYVCLHWSQHLSESSQSSLLLDELSEFAYSRLLYWLEVLSLLKKVDMGDLALSSALQWIGSTVEGLSTLLPDARRLLMMFMFPISLCTPHIYMSMLPLMSKESPLAAHYLKATSALAFVERIGNRGSTPLLRLFRLVAENHVVIRTVTFSLDCTRIALGLFGGDVYIWDTESGEMALGPLKGYLEDAPSLAFSPDGARIVLGSIDCMIRSWSITNGESMAGPFKGHTNGITSVTFSSDGNRIVSGSRDRTVIIWDSWSGMIVSGPLRKHAGVVHSVDFSPNGARAVSGSEDCTLILWDVESGQALFSFEGDTGGVSCVKFSPDGLRIVSGSWDRKVIVWNALTGELIYGPLEDQTLSTNCSIFSRDGSRIVSIGGDGTVRIWNFKIGIATSRPLIGHTNKVMSATFTPDGTRIVSCSKSCEIAIWDAGVEETSGSSERHTDEVLLVSFSPDSSRIYSAYRDNKLQIWDTRSGETISKPLLGYRDIKCVALSPDCKHLALSSYDNKINIFDTESGEAMAFYSLSYINYLNFSPDGTQLVSCSGDKFIRIGDVKSCKFLYGPFERDKIINSVTFSPDGTRILLGFNDGTIQICDKEDGDVLASLSKDNAGSVSAITFSPCGTRIATIASGSRNNAIIIWDYKNGQVISTLYGHTHKVLSISFSPDGSCIASGSSDKTFRIWNIISAELIFDPFIGHSGHVKSIAFSPDGTSIVSGSLDGTMRIWDVTKANISSGLGEVQKLGGTSNMSLLYSPNLPDMSNWTLDGDGWIRGSQGELLLWIPSALRPTLWHTRNTAFFGGEFQTRLDFSSCLHGVHWQECFNPPQ